jgi:acetylornithine deacetylase/succinyl-diaminopimelate desuccinylase-like protein
MNDRFETIDYWFVAEALPVLEEYVTLPCLSPGFDPDWSEHGAIDQALELFATFASEQEIPGLKLQIHRIDGLTPLLVIDVPASSGAVGTSLIYGHLDKQPPLGDWSEGLDPFRPVRRGELLYGRGTADDGYALFAALGALKAMVGAGRSHGRCLIVIEASEESGSPHLEAHLDALTDSLGAIDLVVCLDSGALDYERLWTTTSLRGIVVVTLRIDVLRHGIHSGEGGGVVPSAFRILRQLLDRVEDSETGEVLLEELAVLPPSHALAAASALSAELDDPLARHFPILPGLELMGRDGADRLIRQAWSAALTVTGFEGIPPIAQGGNVLEPSTVVKLSMRVPPNVDAELARAALVRTLSSDPPAGASITVTSDAIAQGWVAPEPDRWLADALDEASEVGFGRGPGSLGEGGSIPFLASLGQRFPNAQFVATGLLGPGSNAHGIDESLHLPSAIGITKALAHLLEVHGSEERRRGAGH